MIGTDLLYLGFDLSTQQLKALAVTSDLKVVYEAQFDFDVDSKGFDVEKGVQTNEEECEVFAPVALWLHALDGVLQRLSDQGIDFSRVRGISGAGQQHGSVYWSREGEKALQSLDKNKSLEEQLEQAFSYPFSPNWQDASTQKECDAFDEYLGGPDQLALITGSKAHHVIVSQGIGVIWIDLILLSALLALKYSDSGTNIPKNIRGPHASPSYPHF